MYTIQISNFLDSFNKCYKKILVINNFPNGPLKDYISRIPNKKLSPFQSNTPCCPSESCIFVINSISNNYYNNFMTIDEIPELICFLENNNYVIHEKMNEIINDSSINFKNPLLFFFTYKN